MKDTEDTMYVRNFLFAYTTITRTKMMMKMLNSKCVGIFHIIKITVIFILLGFRIGKYLIYSAIFFWFIFYFIAISLNYLKSFIRFVCIWYFYIFQSLETYFLSSYGPILCCVYIII